MHVAVAHGLVGDIVQMVAGLHPPPDFQVMRVAGRVDRRFQPLYLFVAELLHLVAQPGAGVALLVRPGDRGKVGDIHRSRQWERGRWPATGVAHSSCGNGAIWSGRAARKSKMPVSAQICSPRPRNPSPAAPSGRCCRPASRRTSPPSADSLPSFCWRSGSRHRRSAVVAQQHGQAGRGWRTQNPASASRHQPVHALGDNALCSPCPGRRRRWRCCTSSPCCGIRRGAGRTGSGRRPDAVSICSRNSTRASSNSPDRL